MKEEDKEDFKKEISDLLSIDEPGEIAPQFEIDPVEPLNTALVTQNAKNKAQKLVLSCLKLYFDEKVIDKNEFMQAKASVTTANIMTLFKQIKIAEHFIDKIVNEVDNGKIEARLFEVATGIQSNIVDMLKNTQLHVISMQEEYRRLQGEMPKSELTDRSLDVTNSDGSTSKVYTNAKALLRDMDEEDVEGDDMVDDVPE